MRCLAHAHIGCTCGWDHKALLRRLPDSLLTKQLGRMQSLAKLVSTRAVPLRPTSASHRLRPTVCIPQSASYSLHPTVCALQSASYSLHPTVCPLQSASHSLRTTVYIPPSARLRAADPAAAWTSSCSH